MDAQVRLYEGAELDDLRALVRHVIPVPAYMVEKVRREFAARPFSDVIVLARVRGTTEAVPCSDGAGAILEAATSVFARIEDVEDGRALAARVADSARSHPVEIRSPVRLLQMAIAIAGMSATTNRAKAAREALSGIWSRNRLKEVIGPSTPRAGSRPSPFARVTDEGHLAGVFARLVEFDELVCAGEIRPCEQNFAPSLVVSFAFISSVYESADLAEATAAIDARMASYRDLSLKMMPPVTQRAPRAQAAADAESSDEEEDDAEPVQVPEEARARFETFLAGVIEKHGKRAATLLVREAAKRLRS